MLMHHKIRKMDAIVALGSNDTRVAVRARELFLDGYGDYLICAGGNGKNSDFNEPEAIVFSKIMIKMGIPEDKIILETQSSNTGENMQFFQKLLHEKGLGLHSFILVTKPYMERRAYATFRKQWPDVQCLVTSPQLTFEEYSYDEEYKQRFMGKEFL